jgi:2-polyprenyl-6-methoxyphenol hydroxylase-like FAD-dependent oxidoreductase
VGGSLSGLMNAIVLRKEGYTVQVLERSHPSKLISEAAGLGVGPNVHTFLETYAKKHEDYGIAHTEINIWNENAELAVSMQLPYTMRMTNWKILYDIFKDALLEDDPTLPTAVYKTLAEVTDVREADAGVAVRYRDLDTGDEGVLQVDLVIAADGANSCVRNQLWQPISPGYAGYCLWRGRVSDQLVSSQTQEALGGKAVFQKLSNGYMLSSVSLLPELLFRP